MRQRTLKPGFFTNERLATLPPMCRLFFAGLWLIADRDGRFEDRPARLKAQLLPYDDADAEDLLANLARLGFIVRYTVDGECYCSIPTFRKHQNPHPKEIASVIPMPCNYTAETHLNAARREKVLSSNAGSSGPSGPSFPSGSSGPSLTGERERESGEVDAKAAAEIDAIRADHAAEEKRLTENLLAIRDAGEDVQTVLDSVAEKGRKPFSAYQWLRNGRSGVPESAAGVTVLRLLNAALEARQRAQDRPVISDSMSQTLESLRRSGERIKARMAAEGKLIA